MQVLVKTAPRAKLIDDTGKRRQKLRTPGHGCQVVRLSIDDDTRQLNSRCFICMTDGAQQNAAKIRDTYVPSTMLSATTLGLAARKGALLFFDDDAVNSTRFPAQCFLLTTGTRHSGSPHGWRLLHLCFKQLAFRDRQPGESLVHRLMFARVELGLVPH